MATADALLAALTGVAVTGGLWLVVFGVRGSAPGPARPVRTSIARRLGRPLARRMPFALLAGFAVLVGTRWPVAAIGAAALVLAWPALFGGAAAERAAIARVDALRMWTEALRDTIAGAAGLEQAIPATTAGAQPVLVGPLHRLAARMHARTPTAQALQAFADDLDDPSADLIIAPLILNAQLRGPGLREVLSSLADNAREQVSMRSRVLSQRAGLRRGTHIIVAVTVVAVLGLGLFNRDFVAPYATVTGQLVLALVLGLFALGFAALRALAEIKTPGRFLASTQAAGGDRR